MSRTVRRHAETSLSQSVNDLVAEGGYALASDDTTVSTVEETIDNSTPVDPRQARPQIQPVASPPAPATGPSFDQPVPS